MKELKQKDTFLDDEIQDMQVSNISDADHAAYHESEVKKIKQKNENYNDNLTWINLKSLVFKNLFGFLGISFLLGLLIFLLNMLMGVSLGINQFADSVKSKLGIYFYIKDIPDQKDQIYSKLINMQQELKNNNISFKFYDKETAFDTLQQKIPDIVKTFSKYGIKNPLPATMYIVVNNSEQYSTMRAVIGKYSNIIINNEDIDSSKSYLEQRQRVINIINLSNFITILSYGLVGFIIVLTIVFILFIIRFKFSSFIKIVEIEKLVGASFRQIKKPFLLDVLLITILGFAIGIGLLFFTKGYVDMYISGLFNTDINSLTNVTDSIGLYILGEFIFLAILIQIASNFFVHRLIKKI